MSLLVEGSEYQQAPAEESEGRFEASVVHGLHTLIITKISFNFLKVSRKCTGLRLDFTSWDREEVVLWSGLE